MERRRSKAVAEDYQRTLRLEELVDAYAAREAGDGACPFCGGEIVAPRGATIPSIGAVSRTAAFSPHWAFRCRRTGWSCARAAACGASVHFGHWGGVPHWRCDANPRHRGRISRSHLRLPKMRALVPTRELKMLDRQFGTRRPTAAAPKMHAATGTCCSGALTSSAATSIGRLPTPAGLPVLASMQSPGESVREAPQVSGALPPRRRREVPTCRARPPGLAEARLLPPPRPPARLRVPPRTPHLVLPTCEGLSGSVFSADRCSRSMRRSLSSLSCSPPYFLVRNHSSCREQIGSVPGVGRGKTQLADSDFELGGEPREDRFDLGAVFPGRPDRRRRRRPKVRGARRRSERLNRGVRLALVIHETSDPVSGVHQNLGDLQPHLRSESTGEHATSAVFRRTVLRFARACGAPPCPCISRKGLCANGNMPDVGDRLEMTPNEQARCKRVNAVRRRSSSPPAQFASTRGIRCRRAREAPSPPLR